LGDAFDIPRFCLLLFKNRSSPLTFYVHHGLSGLASQSLPLLPDRGPDLTPDGSAAQC
jgi:hypothetical protein